MKVASQGWCHVIIVSHARDDAGSGMKQKGYGAKKLEELNSNKSQGPDEIRPRLLIAAPLAKLFENSLVQDVVPNDWREANISALFKKGSNSASQNYRPVSFTSVILMLMASIIKDEIIKHLNIFKFIN